MADPLPHPSKDTRKKPNPNSKPSSPYQDWRDYTGKGKGLAKGASNEDQFTKDNNNVV